jgi:hypothetical protein
MRYDGHSELLKAAPKRLRDAWELMEHPSRDPGSSDAAYRHLCAAHYLAGYAVECILKVYIILLLDARNGPRFSKWSDVIDHFGAQAGSADLRGRQSHNLARLRVVAELEPEMDTDANMKMLWGICSKWDYNVRYSPEFMTDRESVRQLVEACEQVFRWVRNRLPFP